ncbi:MAG TPA: efflux RND transporter periplasmic adaptor subunit [Candidatus Acidoferrales bacterium]|nr:efflux RND transporter periplasmic adaptor subunit [Candidatus Acidoferrales bacterium]
MEARHQSGESGRSGPRRLLWALAAAIAAGALVFSGIHSRSKSEAALDEETLTLAVPSVSILHPRRSEPKQEIVLPANIQPYSDAPIYARTNGYLKKWYVDIGGRVKKGQLLAEIDTPEVNQQLEQARAELATAEANERLAQITAKRYQDLMSSDAVSKQDVDNAAGNLQSTRAQAQSALENVKRLEYLQAFEKIYAPFDGVITARNVDVGNLIDSGGGGPQKEMFHIAAIRELRVYVNVPQIDSPSAKPGMTAYLTLPQFPGRRFAGKLVRTANAIDPASRTLLVEVDVANESGTLLPGGYAEVHLALPTLAATVILPVNTLIFREGGMEVATVNDGKHVRMTPIVLGRDFGTEVEVVSGVGENDAVIVSPPDSLVAGEEVRIVSPAGGGARP